MEEGSSQTYRSTSEIPKQEHYDRRDQELERLRRLVRDLELEVLDWSRRRNHRESPEGSVNTRDSHGEASYQSGSHRSRERSQDFVDRVSTSPERCRHRSAMMDAMSRALCRVARSLFSDEIERAQMS